MPGGPATGGTEGWYDCDNLRNDSPNNTGLVEFPHQTGTGMDAGKVRGNNLWWSRGNPSSANGCPEFPRQRTAPAGRRRAPNYGATPTQGCPYVNDQGLTVMNGPLYRYESGADNTPPLARSTGTAAGSCTTTAAPASSTACCWTRRPTRTPACRSTPTASATRCPGRAPTWTPSSALTARCTCRPTTASSARARTSASTATTTSAAPRRRAPTRVRSRSATVACASRAPAPAASRGSGTSVTARPSPTRPTRRTPTPRPSATRRR